MIDSKQPTVSIVMPTYNRARLLPDTITTVLSQDYDDFELLVVDDGSIDNTRELLHTLQQEDDRVRYLPLEKNGGIASARNFGIQHARGDYIAMIDSDDHWLPGKLSQQVRIMEHYPFIDFLFGDYVTTGMYEGGVSARGFELTTKSMSYLKKERLEDNLWFITGGAEKGILVENFIAASTILFRKSVISLTEGYKDFVKLADDVDFYWRAAVSGARFAYIDKVIQSRQVYVDSVTRRNPIQFAQSQLHGLEVCRETCASVGRKDLLPFVHAKEQRIWQKLLLIYGHENRKWQLIQNYTKSLRYGFSHRTLLCFIAGLIGSRFVDQWTLRNSRKSS